MTTLRRGKPDMDAGTSERAVRELRAEGWLIEQRRDPDPRRLGWRYQLVGRRPPD
jgi:hypothetical protein